MRLTSPWRGSAETSGSSEAIAKQAGVSHHKADLAVRVTKAATKPEIEAVIAGKKKLAAVDREIKERLGEKGSSPAGKKAREGGEVGEGLVKGRQVAVLFGVGEDAVAVEDEGGHQRPPLPALPNCSASSLTIAITSARVCLNSDGGSHLLFCSACLRKAREDCM